MQAGSGDAEGIDLPNGYRAVVLQDYCSDELTVSWLVGLPYGPGS